MFINQILTLLVTPPGNLIYHIVLVFSIAGALQGAIRILRSSQFPQARRTVLGLCILLGLQVFLFIISGLVGQGLLDSKTVLPPLDRALTMLALVWITWLWAFPEPARAADLATLLLNLLVMILWGLTMVFWAQNPVTGFNASILDKVWQGFSLVVVLLGILLLAVRKPNGWGNGLAMLLLAFIGHLLGLFWPMVGDFSGYIRLTQLAFFPLLLTILQRFPISISVSSPEGKVDSLVEGEPTSERRRFSTDPKTLQTLMSLAAETDTGNIGSAMTHGIAQALLADLCFLLTLSEDKCLSIACGYDLVRDEAVEGAAVNKDAIPLLANAILRGRPLRLPGSSTSSDLKGLGQLLNLTNPGNLLCVPITSRERGPVGGILILSPYSNRLWSAEDQAYLANVSTLCLPILERSHRAALLETESAQARQDAQSAQDQAAAVNKKYEDAVAELEKEQGKVVQAQVQAENMAALLVMREESQKTIESLKAQIEQMRQVGEGGEVPVDSAKIERELNQTLEELARMQNALADANVKILKLEHNVPSPVTSEQVEVIASISQELRQPMSSIVGYTDLLMGESVGILGALQRKFVERIKASTERIGCLVDDLIQVTNLETGRMEFKSDLIDLNLIIDNALAYTSTQIREKNITLRLDIPESAPQVQTDGDALQQIFIHLLQNATAATPAEGTITLRVQMQSESNQHFVAIQVTDTGGGIAADDIPRVFARRYRADRSLIQGLGDTGVGLSIAKAIVEAQGGRIWIETEAGSGTTFSILLPVLLEAEEEK